jgi:hypothetical protein
MLISGMAILQIEGIPCWGQLYVSYWVFLITIFFFWFLESSCLPYKAMLSPAPLENNIDDKLVHCYCFQIDFLISCWLINLVKFPNQLRRGNYFKCNMSCLWHNHINFVVIFSCIIYVTFIYSCKLALSSILQNIWDHKFSSKCH